MKIINEGINVAAIYDANYASCIQHFQEGCGGYCNCHCNGDH